MPSVAPSIDYATADKSIATTHENDSPHSHTHIHDDSHTHADDRRYKKPWLRHQLFTIDEIYGEYVYLYDTVKQCMCV